MIAEMTTSAPTRVPLELMIHDMTPPYESQVWTLAQEMWKESIAHRGMKLERDKLMQQLRASQKNPNVYFKIAVRGGEVLGGFFGVINTVYFSDERAARDLAWFVRRSSRGGAAAVRLVADFERWGLSKGVKQFFLGQSTGVNIEITKTLYEKLGYRVVGVNTVKEY